MCRRHTRMVTRSRHVGMAFPIVLLVATAACTNRPGTHTPSIAVRRDVGYATSLTASQLQGMASTGDRFTMTTTRSLPKRALTAPNIASQFARSASARKLDAIVLGFLSGDTPVIDLHGNRHRTFKPSTRLACRDYRARVHLEPHSRSKAESAPDRSNVVGR